jgi:hypothetical protein
MTTKADQLCMLGTANTQTESTMILIHLRHGLPKELASPCLHSVVAIRQITVVIIISQGCKRRKGHSGVALFIMLARYQLQKLDCSQ